MEIAIVIGLLILLFFGKYLWNRLEAAGDLVVVVLLLLALVGFTLFG